MKIQNYFQIVKKERLDLKLKIDGKNYQKIIQYKYLDLLVFTLKENNLITRIKKNNSRIIKKKNHKFSRVHLEDISGFLFNSLENFKSGEIYNIADDKPFQMRKYK